VCSSDLLKGPPYPYKYREVTSLAALLSLGSASLYGFLDLQKKGLPSWMLGVFFFSTLGSYGGFLWELFGDLNWRAAEIVESFRRANVGLVMGAGLASTLAVCLGGWKDEYTALVAFLTSFLAIESFLNHPYPAAQGKPQGGLRSLWVAVLQRLGTVGLILYGMYGNHLVNPSRGYYLIAANLLNLLSLSQVNSSLLFHGIATIASIFDHKFYSQVNPIPTPQINWHTALGGVVTGFLMVLTNTVLRNQLRFTVTNNLWQVIYGGLMATTFPAPKAPEFVRGPKIPVLDYEQMHPLASPLKILSAQSVPLNQHYPGIYNRVDRVFKVISVLDRFLPQGNVRTLPEGKPRIDPKRPVEFYLPQSIIEYGTSTRFVPPPLLINWHNKKQGIAWMTLYGHISPLLEILSDDNLPKFHKVEDCTHIVNLSWMRKYNPKPGFYGYGGIAYFKYQPQSDHPLVLKYITPINNDMNLLSVDEPSQELDLAIKGFASSTGIISVAGFHLAGIHMYFNLVGLSLYNIYDIISPTPKYTHPFRAAMNIHFYNHVLVEEKTTAHLMDRGGVFNQIFALDHDSICNFVQDRFNFQEYAYDADLERRSAVFGDSLPEHSQLHLQKEYLKIFQEYAHNLVTTIWDSDDALRGDILTQKFYEELNGLNMRRNNDQGAEMPIKYSFQTREGVEKFISETIFVLIVLHEVYGTKVPTYGTHSEILPSQVAIDGKPPTLEDYTSLLLVTAATSRVKFSNLLEQDPVAPFENCLEGERLSKLFFGLQQRLRELEIKWTSNAEEVFINEQYHRILPSDLEVGAGY